MKVQLKIIILLQMKLCKANQIQTPLTKPDPLHVIKGDMAPQEQGYGVVWQDMLVHEFTSPMDMSRLHYKRKLGRAYSRKVAQGLHIGTTVNLYLLKELYITYFKT